MEDKDEAQAKLLHGQAEKNLAKNFSIEATKLKKDRNREWNPDGKVAEVTSPSIENKTGGDLNMGVKEFGRKKVEEIHSDLSTDT